MKVIDPQLYHLQIPLRFQFSQANNAGTRTSDSAIVKIITEEGKNGYGEACPRLYVTGESIQTMRDDLKLIGQYIKSISINSIDEIKLALKHIEKLGVGNSTLCAVELSLLDALSQEQNKTILELLQIDEECIPAKFHYSLILPLVKPKYMVMLLEKLKHAGFPNIKLKVDANQQKTLENIHLIREYFGQNIPIRVDVNGGWVLGQAISFMPELMKKGKIHSFEQPVDLDNLEGLKILTGKFGREAQIMPDESLLSPKRARELCENGMGNHFNLKLSKIGGIFRCLEVHEIGSAFGIPSQLGAHFAETSILTHAGAIFAGMVNKKLTALEGAMGVTLLEQDLTARPLQCDLNGIMNYETWKGHTGWLADYKQELLA